MWRIIFVKKYINLINSYYEHRECDLLKIQLSIIECYHDQYAPSLTNHFIHTSQENQVAKLLLFFQNFGTHFNFAPNIFFLIYVLDV